MPGPITVEDLLKLIRQSGVIDGTALARFLEHRSFEQPAKARDVADEMVRKGVLTNFQAEQLLQGKWRGFTIGRYKYLERIGIGGMGQVFLCEHLHTRRRVAIKVLPPAKAEQPAALGRFYREARAAAALQHPNVVRIHDISQDGEFHFIVMDYIAGPNLLDLVKRFGPLDIGRAASYVHQVAGALDYAFRSGIIHRDVKPGNVMIDGKGVAHLLDLGLARFLNDHADQLTLKYDDKIVLGTADYVAPEQIENSHAVDTRADIYALGSTFYFLLAGHPPFPTGTVSQKLLWHRTKDPTLISDVRPDVPPGLASILSRMMARDPKERYQTPAQVMSDLEHWVPDPVPLPRSEEMPRLSVAATATQPRERQEGDRIRPDAGETARSSSTATPTSIPAMVPSEPLSEGQSATCTEPTASPQDKKAKRFSESETVESAALTVTPCPQQAPRVHSPRCEQASPEHRGWPRWVAVGAVLTTVLGILILILR
jgi:serine/threonine protein kinase